MRTPPRFWSVSTCLLIAAAFVTLAVGQEEKLKTPKSTKSNRATTPKSGTRKTEVSQKLTLPPHYDQLDLQPDQNTKVMAVQIECARKIRELLTQADVDCEALLTAEQLKKLKDLRAAAERQKAEMDAQPNGTPAKKKVPALKREPN